MCTGTCTVNFIRSQYLTISALLSEQESLLARFRDNSSRLFRSARLKFPTRADVRKVSSNILSFATQSSSLGVLTFSEAGHPPSWLSRKPWSIFLKAWLCWHRVDTFAVTIVRFRQNWLLLKAVQTVWLIWSCWSNLNGPTCLFL